MTCKEFLASQIEQLEKLIQRVEAVAAKVDANQLNWKPSLDKWSIGQILDHILIGMNYYGPGIESGLQTGKKTSSDQEVKHSWFGRQVIKGIGPGGKAPVLKQLIPGSGPYDTTITSKFVERHRQLIESCRRAEGIDLSSVKLRNPFFKLFRMNLADYLAILVAHTEGHVVQIEELAAKAQTS